VEELLDTSTREAERRMAAHFPETCSPEKSCPLDGEHTHIEFNASRQLCERLRIR
jgi:hypothetical protein